MNSLIEVWWFCSIVGFLPFLMLIVGRICLNQGLHFWWTELVVSIKLKNQDVSVIKLELCVSC